MCACALHHSTIPFFSHSSWTPSFSGVSHSCAHYRGFPLGITPTCQLQSYPITSTQPAMFVAATAPPVPHKLVQKNESGEFIDTSELLPLGCSHSPQLSQAQPSFKHKKRHVSTILEWVQCFGLYSSVNEEVLHVYLISWATNLL